MQQRDIAERVEFEQFGFGQFCCAKARVKCCRRPQGRRGGADLEDFTAGDHGMPRQSVIRSANERARTATKPSHTFEAGPAASAIDADQCLMPGTLSFSPSFCDAR